VEGGLLIAVGNEAHRSEAGAVLRV